MEHVGRNQPPGARLEPVGLGQVEDAVVALVPPLQAAAELFLLRPRLEPEESVREVVARPVELGREVVALGLPFPAELGGLLLVLVHVVRDRAQVVEELAVDGPLLVGVPEPGPDHLGSVEADGVAEGEFLAAVNDVAQTLVRGCALVGRRGRRGEPAFVDAAPMGPQRVEIVA